MVISIHVHPFEDINSELGYIFTQIIPRIAVPFFFAVAGYFYIPKVQERKDVFLKYIKKILFTYFIWSLLYYAIELVQRKNCDIKNYVISCAKSFIITGSFYHFWFFPALIFSVIITTLIFKSRLHKLLIPMSIICYIFGCLGSSYYNIGIHLPMLGEVFKKAYFEVIRRILCIGVPFFISGYVVYKIEKKLEGCKQKKIYTQIFFLASLLCFIIEIEMVRILNLQKNIIITFWLYGLVCAMLLLLLQNPMTKCKNMAKVCRIIANFTYYAHPFCIVCVLNLSKKILKYNISQTPLFLITTLITFVFGYIIYKLDNSLINKIVK